MAENPGVPSAEQVASVLAYAGELSAQIDGHVTRYGDSELTDVLQALLRVRATLEGAALSVVIEADSRGVVPQSTATGLSEWVRAVANEVDVPMTGADANSWAQLTHECRRPDSTVLRAACTTGRIPVSTGAVLGRELRVIRSQVSADMWDTCADAFIKYAVRGASGKELRQARDVVVTQYGDGDWIDKQQREARQRRAFTGFRPDGPGTQTARLTLPDDDVAAVEALLGALSAPRPGSDGEADPRTAPQRRADALVEACGLIAAQQAIPEEQRGIGNGCAQIVVTMDFDWLRNQCGYGLTVDGEPISPTTVRRFACDAQIIPMVLGSQGQPLDVGRASRLATPSQVKALRQRDKGCTFDGCDRPPTWCQAHHVVSWLDGGPTELSNLALLCQRHHTVVHRDGYTASVTDTGVTWHRPLSRGRPRSEAHHVH